MTRLPRLLRLSLVVILLISVFALIFVAYTQHEEQQYWKSKYQDTIAPLPVTLSLSWFGSNPTDVYKTKFMDSLHENIEPVKIEMHNAWDAVTFWFEKRDVGNGTILLHLPNQNEGSYNPIDVPFFDVRLCVPPYK